MGFRYDHLGDADVRSAMVAGWSAERADLLARWPRDQCYGKLLTDEGWAAYEVAMPKGLGAHDDEWLLAEMSAAEYWMAKSPRQTKNVVTMVNYNKQNALERLVYSEFNIAYIHGLAETLLARGETECVVYRAGFADEPRSECAQWEGQTFLLNDVLAGHRARYFPPPGNPHAWSVPSVANCHHSIRATSI
ncbi:MAG: hypothetical protein M3Y49_10105 [Actinomycetota bacterium]|nr:hypothetical protein [Actinomycetota bacterium]